MIADIFLVLVIIISVVVLIFSLVAIYAKEKSKTKKIKKQPMAVSSNNPAQTRVNVKELMQSEAVNYLPEDLFIDLLTESKECIYIDSKVLENAKQGISNKPKYKKTDSDCLVAMEFDNRKRILNESVSLVEKTKNIDVMVGRKNIAIEQLDWFITNKGQGYMNLNPPPKEGKEKLLEIFNERLTGRISELVESQLNRIEILKTEKAKLNAQNKAIDIIHASMNKLDKVGSNFQEMEEDLGELYSKVEQMNVK